MNGDKLYEKLTETYYLLFLEEFRQVLTHDYHTGYYKKMREWFREIDKELK